MNEQTKHRIKDGGYSHAKADARKNKRRAAAEARQAVYSATPVEERLAGLDRRDLEARRERAKLYPLAHCVVIVPNKRKIAKNFGEGLHENLIVTAIKEVIVDEAHQAK